MAQSLEIELTAADIRILIGLIYDGVPRIWLGGEWGCPHCLELNDNAITECACGVRRDSEPGALTASEGRKVEETLAPLDLLIAAALPDALEALYAQ
jgi:hypothetical protein